MQKFLSVFEEIFVLVKTPEMRKRTLNIFFSWLIVAMAYYGLSLNSKNLGGDRYVNGFLSGFVEVRKIRGHSITTCTKKGGKGVMIG